ncbi:hypothetical protein LSAT2_015929 [Lamellibrachia satsuma]|nr:hypothetical protein LSAT2_015929 [Lamellibrachia satsuma]
MDIILQLVDNVNDHNNHHNDHNYHNYHHHHDHHIDHNAHHNDHNDHHDRHHHNHDHDHNHHHTTTIKTTTTATTTTPPPPPKFLQTYEETLGGYRFSKIAIPNNNSRWQVDKKAIGNRRVRLSDTPVLAGYRHLCFIVTMTSFIVLLVLLVVVALPCGAWLFGERKCSGKLYNENTHVCCDGKLNELPEEREFLSCCHHEMFYVSTHHCCRNSGGEVRLVPVEPGKHRWEICSKVVWEKSADK